MKKVVPLFLLFIMALNVVAPLVEQLRGGARVELSEDMDEKSKTENEESKEGKTESKEKEAFLFADFSANHLSVAELKRLKKSLFSNDERLISELFAFSPERPPEA